MVNILALLGIGSDFMDLVVADSVIVSDHEGRYGWLFDRTNESRCSGSILISQNKSFLYVTTYRYTRDTNPVRWFPNWKRFIGNRDFESRIVP